MPSSDFNRTVSCSGGLRWRLRQMNCALRQGCPEARGCSHRNRSVWRTVNQVKKVFALFSTVSFSTIICFAGKTLLANILRVCGVCAVQRALI